MQTAAGRERRQQPRKLITIDVVLSCKAASTERYTVGVHDLSLTGMAIYPGDLALTTGDSLCICLSAAAAQCDMDHVIEATVVHRHAEYVGIRFDSVGIHVLKDIQRLLRHHREQ